MVSYSIKSVNWAVLFGPESKLFSQEVLVHNSTNLIATVFLAFHTIYMQNKVDSIA